jgi:hypothetical protein
MEFKGTITWAGEVKSGIGKTGNPYAFQDIIIEEYAPKNIAFPNKLLGSIANPDIISSLKVGAIATIHYNLKVSEHNGKNYGKNEVWRISYENENNTQPTQQSQPPQETTNSDLPF